MATKKKRKRKVKKGFLAIIIALSVLLVAAASLWAVITFVPNINILTVKSVLISGDKVYPDDVIVSKSGIKIGITVFKYNFNKIKKNIQKDLPYVKTADINFSIDGTVNINITSTKVAYSLKAGDVYHRFDEDLKLLEKSATTSDGIVLFGFNLSDKMQVGDYIEIEKSDSEQIQTMLEIVRLLNMNSIDIGVIDVADLNNIMLIYDERYVVELGDMNYIEDKIKLLSTMVKDLHENETGKILLKFWSNEDRYGSVLDQNIDEYLNNY